MASDPVSSRPLRFYKKCRRGVPGGPIGNEIRAPVRELSYRHTYIQELWR